MYLRRRNLNLSIERAIYEPAKKDANGNVCKPAVRTTHYVGSIKTYARFCEVPSEVISQLSEEERAELQEVLRCNEPKPFTSIDYAISSLNSAVRELSSSSEKLKQTDIKKLLEGKIKSIDAAWDAFFRAAQEQGLKRKRKSVRKSPASDSPSAS